MKTKTPRYAPSKSEPITALGVTESPSFGGHAAASSILPRCSPTGASFCRQTNKMSESTANTRYSTKTRMNTKKLYLRYDKPHPCGDSAIRLKRSLSETVAKNENPAKRKPSRETLA